jgi:hypothetical protein
MDHQPTLERLTEHDVPFLTDRAALERGWLLGFTSRVGGVSSPPFDTLNLATSGGDAPSDVMENRRRASLAVGFSASALAFSRQVHGAGMLEVAPGEAGLLGEADVLMAREPGPVLAILTADCAPVLVIGTRGAAIAHAGWRGLVAGAIENAVAAVAPVAAAWVGPCIHACCYEVGPEVVAAFRAAGLPVSATDRVDPAQAAGFALRRAGVDRIVIADVCTACNPDWYSYRRDGVTGRQGAFLALAGD